MKTKKDEEDKEEEEEGRRANDLYTSLVYWGGLPGSASYSFLRIQRG